MSKKSDHDGLTPRQRQENIDKAKQAMMATCPVCKGVGSIEAPNKKTKHLFEQNLDISIMAKLLRQAGYSLREIGKFLGYTSPRSVQNLLAKHNLK